MKKSNRKLIFKNRSWDHIKSLSLEAQKFNSYFCVYKFTPIGAGHIEYCVLNHLNKEVVLSGCPDADSLLNQIEVSAL